MWEPIVDQELKVAVDAAIDEFVNDIAKEDQSNHDAQLLCEQALFYSYLAASCGIEKWGLRSFELLNQAIDNFVASTFRHLGLYGGLSGFGWTLQHTISMLSSFMPQVIDSNEVDALSELDQFFLDFDLGRLNGNFSLSSGSVGIGLYWLARLPRKEAVRGVERVVDALSRMAIDSPLGTTWLHPRNISRSPTVCYDLSLSEGVPSVIGFLSRVSNLSILDNERRQCVASLLSDSIRWMLAQRRPPHKLSRFSMWAIPGQDSGNTSLCCSSGDLGIAAILQSVSRSGPGFDVQKFALNLVARCKVRSESEDVYDASLTQGAIGVGHVFNRFYQSRRDPDFRVVARKWIERGLKIRARGGRPGDLFARDPMRASHKREDRSLISGGIGIALGLLAANGSTEPRWDRILLLS